ncbi:hypothetical protein POTOM_043032 [Populus tomentosa]|uniref:Uncharacterized protein n=1 Tax=Populus tomentosa TaxID=118781 RepID=A0A8X7YR34_POPTO|nr:hypothetical protein POTOM_043032 [Populus tomentosa]
MGDCVRTPKMGDCVLDLCCGSGDLAFLLSEKVGSNGGKVGNLDFSKDQLFMASSRQHLLAKVYCKSIETRRLICPSKIVTLMLFP